MARTSFPFASFPPFPAGELLADRVENEARVRTRLLLSLLFIGPALGAAIMVVSLFFSTRMYEATGRIEVVPNINPRYASARLTKTGLKNHAEMLTGTGFREQVFRNLPTSFQQLLPSAKHLMQKKRTVHINPSAALAGLKVRAGQENFMLVMSYRNRDPDLAAAVVRTALVTAETQPLRQSGDRAARAAVFLNAKLDTLEAQIEAEEAALDKIQGTDDPDELTNTAVKARTLPGAPNRLIVRRNAKRKGAGYQSFQSTMALRFKDERQDPLLYQLQLADNRARLIERLADSRLHLIQTLEAAGTEVVLSNPGQAEGRKQTVGGLRQHLAQLQASYAALAVTLAPNNPEMLSALSQINAVQKQVDDAQARILTQAQTTDTAAHANAAAVGTALKERTRVVQQKLQGRVGTAILELELAVDLSVYEDYLQLLASRPAQTALEADSLDVVDLPTMPLKPMKKPYADEARYGATLGGIIAFVAVILLYYLRARIWRIHQAEDASGMGIITILPHMTRSAGQDGHSDIISAPTDAFEQGIDELRTNLGILGGYLSAQTIVITSASPSQGKTTTATHLAVRLAQDGHAVLLIDADLHRPVVHLRLGLDKRVGLSTLLSGKATFQESVQHYPGLATLDVLTAGPTPPMPSELLQSMAMEQVILEARNHYRYILIDTAPVLAAGDAVFLSSRADLLFLLARFAQVELRLLRQTQKLLSHSDVPYAGLIINDVRPTWFSRLRFMLPTKAGAVSRSWS